MNSFGTVFRVQVLGESHGELVGVTLDGVPPGIPLSEEDFTEALERRKGLGVKGTTPRKEEDRPVFQTGIFNGTTTGAPLQIIFANNNMRSQDYQQQLEIPRPSHADWVANKKHKGFNDYRGSGHFSARLTVGIVAAGVVAQKALLHYGQQIDIRADVIAVGGQDTVEEGLAYAIARKDTVGAVVECVMTNVPVALGEPFWDSVESRLSHAMFSIPAVKGIEFGAGFKASSMLGKEHNDPILDNQGTTGSNHSGGIVGGISNGNPIVFRLAFKPAASTPQQQESLNVKTQQLEQFSIKGRHDLCVALRAPVIVEAMSALVLLDLFLLHKTLN